MSNGEAIIYRAGVIGLTTALVLSRENNYNEEEGGGEGIRSKKGYEITVAAKYMPGDYDVEYVSPWAGAHYLPLVIKKNTSLHDGRFFLPISYLLQKITSSQLIFYFYVLFFFVFAMVRWGFFCFGLLRQRHAGFEAGLLFFLVSVIVVVIWFFIYLLEHISLGRLWVKAKVKAGGRF